jgi:hypothetical protein
MKSVSSFFGKLSTRMKSFGTFVVLDPHSGNVAEIRLA